jgi:hypothetical protein
MGPNPTVAALADGAPFGPIDLLLKVASHHRTSRQRTRARSTSSRVTSPSEVPEAVQA